MATILNKVHTARLGDVWIEDGIVMSPSGPVTASELLGVISDLTRTLESIADCRPGCGYDDADFAMAKPAAALAAMGLLDTQLMAMTLAAARLRERNKYPHLVRWMVKWTGLEALENDDATQTQKA